MNKLDRINSELSKRISEIINGGLKHPAITGIISVISVNTANDLSAAKVRISVLNGDPVKVAEALNHSSGYIRRELKSLINIRMIPELNFQTDSNIEYAAKISKIIDEVNKKN